MAARRESALVLAVTTPGRFDATLDDEARPGAIDRGSARS
jgi:hypothetical protein